MSDAPDGAERGEGLDEDMDLGLDADWLRSLALHMRERGRIKPNPEALERVADRVDRLREAPPEGEPPYCLDCGHPPAYHEGGTHCAATIIEPDGEEYPCGCNSERHFLGRDALRTPTPDPPEEGEHYTFTDYEREHIAPPVEEGEEGERDTYAEIGAALVLAYEDGRRLQDVVVREDVLRKIKSLADLSAPHVEGGGEEYETYAFESLLFDTLEWPKEMREEALEEAYRRFRRLRAPQGEDS